jgi:LPS export ABC transporter protein LptC
MDWKKLSKKKRLYFIIAGSMAMILLWAFLTAKVITHDFNRQQVAANKDEQQAIVNGIILTETKNDTKYWEIYGENGKWNSINGVAQLNNVLANFYKDNEVSMSLQSSKGTYDSKTKAITLYKDTFIVLKDGITLNADKLTWINSSSPVIAEGHIKIQKANQLLSTADKIIISPNYDSFKIEGNTVSKVYEDKK